MIRFEVVLLIFVLSVFGWVLLKSDEWPVNCERAPNHPMCWDEPR